jgi:acyl-CoA synthetase (NDP forming)
LEQLLDDPGTEIVGIFLEGLHDGRRFRSLMERAETIGKPVVALVVGASAPAKNVVATHTGRLAGDHRVMLAALRDLGVMVVANFDEMVETLYLLSRRGRRTAGPRIGLVALSGGELSMATDAAYAVGLQTPQLAPTTAARIATELDYPAEARVVNPMDLAGTPGADAEGMLQRRYAHAVTALLDDPGIDSVLVVQDSTHTLNPSLVDWYMEAAAGIVTAAARSQKQAVVVNPLSADVTERFRVLLEDGDVPVLRGLAPGIRALSEVARRRAPAAGDAELVAAAASAFERWTGELASREPDERDVKRLLRDCGVSVVDDRLCTSAGEAAKAAGELGFPVVMKIVAPEILHKSDIGGVRIGIRSATEAAQAFDEIVRAAAAAHPGADVRGVLVAPQVAGGTELVVGGLEDPTFGPLVMAGVGGVFVEAIRDVAFALAPPTHETARRLLDELKGARLLDRFRGTPAVDRDAVADVVARVGALVAAGGGRISSIEVNPLVAGDGAPTALDARIVLTPHGSA